MCLIRYSTPCFSRSLAGVLLFTGVATRHSGLPFVSSVFCGEQLVVSCFLSCILGLRRAVPKVPIFSQQLTVIAVATSGSAVSCSANSPGQAREQRDCSARR